MSAIDIERLRRETFVVEFEMHDEIDSTNTRAMLRVDQVQQFPALVLAERQTAGRGRGNNRWWAGAGGLTLSLLLKSSDHAIPAARTPLISLATGLAVADAVSQFVPAGDVRLKWPNDVYLNGRKVCGILLETSSRRPGVTVVGVGLNVNNSLAEAPLELQSRATSLCDVTGTPVDRTSVLVAMLQRLPARLDLLRQEAGAIVDAWQHRCYLQGRTVQVDSGSPGSNSRSAVGICLGIDADGALMLQTESGIVRCLSGVVARIE